MKLAYIYIQNHKVLEKIDIPINGSHKCSYSSETLVINFYPNELDYYQGIDCSAIIGKNGVGKSTILDFLEVAYDGTDSSGIIVWFDDLKKKYHICAINLYLNENSIQCNQDYILEQDLSNITKQNKIRLIKANNLTGVETNDFLKKKKNNSFVFDMSLSQYIKGSRNVVAKRTNRLIQYFISSEYFNKLYQPKVKFTFQFSLSSTAYLKSLLDDDEFELQQNKKEYLYKLCSNVDEGFFEFNSRRSNEFSSYLLMLNTLSICSYLSKLSIIKKKYRDYFFVELVFGMREGWLSENHINDIFLKILDESEFKDNNRYLHLYIYKLIGKYNNIVNIFDKISDLMECFSTEYEWYDDNKISTFNSEFIIGLTSYIFKLPSLMLNNFKYGWVGFSTGEFAKANLFSELYSYINDKKNNQISNHLIVMDEVDLYLHPDWQRTFFSELLEFIKIEFPEESVQIILSTHSPIIISDFLPEDIVSLDRKNGKTKVVESFGFATHITDLYVEGMHLKSTFGEHSKKAINQLILRSIDKSLTDKDIALIEKIKSKNIQKMILSTNDND